MFLLFIWNFRSLNAEDEKTVSLIQTAREIILMRGKVPILTYNLAPVLPPAGIDLIYIRSGFIHPLHAPSGGEVTGIHPSDHYHHFGLWHAWVNTKYNGKKGPDFWNLGDRTGRIRHVKLLETRLGGFTAILEHVDYLSGIDSDSVVVLRETLSVDAKFSGKANIIDYIITQKNITSKLFEFPANRYGGGIAFRAPKTWDKYNSNYLTSKGMNRSNSHGTRARWVAMRGPVGEVEGEYATVAIFCHPKNFDAPQRIRTWDKNTHNGKMFFNYVPIQDKGWFVESGDSISLSYRILVFDGEIGSNILESHWKAYLN